MKAFLVVLCVLSCFGLARAQCSSIPCDETCTSGNSCDCDNDEECSGYGLYCQADESTGMLSGGKINDFCAPWPEQCISGSGFTFLGDSYTGSSASSAEACCNACTRQGRCTGYVYWKGTCNFYDQVDGSTTRIDHPGAVYGLVALDLCFTAQNAVVTVYRRGFDSASSADCNVVNSCDFKCSSVYDLRLERDYNTLGQQTITAVPRTYQGCTCYPVTGTVTIDRSPRTYSTGEIVQEYSYNYPACKVALQLDTAWYTSSDHRAFSGGHTTFDLTGPTSSGVTCTSTYTTAMDSGPPTTSCFSQFNLKNHAYLTELTPECVVPDDCAFKCALEYQITVDEERFQVALDSLSTDASCNCLKLTGNINDASYATDCSVSAGSQPTVEWSVLAVNSDDHIAVVTSEWVINGEPITCVGTYSTSKPDIQPGAASSVSYAFKSAPGSTLVSVVVLGLVEIMAIVLVC